LKVRIFSVSKNYGRSINGRKGICHESWIYGELENGTKIKIFDMNCKIPEEYAKKSVELLILASITTEFSTSIEMSGNIIKKYNVPKKWLKNSPEIEDIQIGAIETSNGLFLIDSTDRELQNLDLKKRVNLNVVKFTLISWITPNEKQIIN
jgi:hypothetical protein